jgi:hypothetical protein
MIELSQGEVHDFSGEVKKFQGNAREVRTTPRLIPSKSGDAFIKDGKITSFVWLRLLGSSRIS